MICNTGPVFTFNTSQLAAFTDLTSGKGFDFFPLWHLQCRLSATPFHSCLHFNLSCHIRPINSATGKGAPEENGSPPAHEHLPASGDRPDAAGNLAGAEHPDGPQAGHRRDHHNEREPAGRPGLHVRRTHPSPLDEGAFRELGSTDFHSFSGCSLHVEVHISRSCFLYLDRATYVTVALNEQEQNRIK